ncbi:hypothetical protein [Comamonas composti]|uniref:hypothetical protein n=1 Tax=Comamonas composti TaxID=408558 RepID=UPI00041232B6|nr:hypothetical protein [Comamonas composti]
MQQITHRSLTFLGSCLGCYLALAAMLAAAATPSPAQAGGSESSQGKAYKRQSNRIKLAPTRSSSEESTAERDRRLYRECQGRPNAGACAGYTQRPPSRQR